VGIKRPALMCNTSRRVTSLMRQGNRMAAARQLSLLTRPKEVGPSLKFPRLLVSLALLCSETVIHDTVDFFREGYLWT
jgi:hypothetical protein